MSFSKNSELDDIRLDPNEDFYKKPDEILKEPVSTSEPNDIDSKPVSDYSEKKSESSVSIRKLISAILIILFSLVAAGLLLPSISNTIINMRQIAIIGGYQSDMLDLDSYTISEMKKEAIEYNRMIFESKYYLNTAFYHDLLAPNYEDWRNDELYNNVLKISPTTGLMGYIEVKNLDIYVPVVHGTDSKDLDYQAGHMYGTSVPIGVEGETTHSVIAAHTGLRSAKLFDDLPKIETGTEVRMHTLNEVYVYYVKKTVTVLPEEVAPYLAMEKDNNFLTLYTCTPYGINSHRFLAICEFDHAEAEQGMQGGMGRATNIDWLMLLKLIGLCLIPLLILILGLLWVFKKKKKKEESSDDDNVIDAEENDSPNSFD